MWRVAEGLGLARGRHGSVVMGLARSRIQTRLGGDAGATFHGGALKGGMHGRATWSYVKV